MTGVKIGDLVRLKPANIIRKRKESTDEDYNPNDWVGVVIGFPGKVTDPRQQELFETCLVMWKGRSAVGEYVDHLEVLQ